MEPHDQRRISASKYFVRRLRSVVAGWVRELAYLTGPLLVRALPPMQATNSASGDAQHRSQRVCSSCGQRIADRDADIGCVACWAACMLEEIAEPELPYEIGGYEICELLGEGEMADVYLGYKKELDRYVAIKRLKEKHAASEQERGRFRLACERQVQLARLSKNRNVAVVLSVDGLSDPRPYFVMEHYSTNLADPRWHQYLRDPVWAVRRVIIPLARVLHLMHDLGYVHLDLKLENVLMDDDGNVYLTDLGVSIATADAVALTGLVVGAPAFMSPEQASGRTLGLHSDVYSLGAVLYYLWTQKLPSDGVQGLAQRRQSLGTDGVISSTRLVPSLDPYLASVCLCALKHEPDERYGSAGAFADDLERVLRNEPAWLSGRRDVGWRERADLWCKAHREYSPARGAVLMLLGVMTFTGLVLYGGLGALLRSSADKASRIVEDFFFEKTGEPLRILTSDLGFGAMVAAHDSVGAEQALQAMDARMEASGKRTPATGNWMLMLGNGDRLVRVPDRGAQSSNRAERDYFKGAKAAFEKAGVPTIYVSRAYKSLDDATDKMALSIVIPDPSNPKRVAGVLALMLKTDTTEARRLGLGDEFQKAVVFSLWDDFGGRFDRDIRWMIWAHTRYLPGEPAILITEALDLDRRRSSMWYFDPAAERYPEFGGPWASGVAQVRGTPVVVVIQTRAWIWIWGILLVEAAGFAAVHMMQVRARKSKSTPTKR